jgi:hypothetical protein
VEVKIFEVLDMFIRESSLGQFVTRLRFLSILRTHLKLKKKSYKGTMKSPLLETVKKGLYTTDLELRLRKVLNIMHFIESYYT